LSSAAPPDVFPAVRLPALDGGERDLGALAGPTLVAFGHADCATTRLLLPYVERIHRRRPPGTEVVVVLQDEAADARALAQEMGLSAPILLDVEPWPLGVALGATTVPLMLLVGADRRIERTFAAFRRADVEEAASLLGAGLPVFAPGDAAPVLRPG
jgi:hypothetical protein